MLYFEFHLQSDGERILIAAGEILRVVACGQEGVFIETDRSKNSKSYGAYVKETYDEVLRILSAGNVVIVKG